MINIKNVIQYSIVALAFIVSTSCAASTCATLDTSAPDLWEQVEKRRDLIFVGKVVSIENTTIELEEMEERIKKRKIGFFIEKEFTDYGRGAVYVHYDTFGCSCDPLVEVGKLYVIFASLDNSDKNELEYYSFNCALVQDIESDPEYLKYKNGKSWSVEGFAEKYFGKLDIYTLESDE